MGLFMFTHVKNVRAFLIVSFCFVCMGRFTAARSLYTFSLIFAAKEELYPVADATTFFTDLHYILRVIAAGNTRTICHHRLNLLEQVNMSRFLIADYRQSTLFDC